MTVPLVLELQSLASTNSTPIDELLRKSLLVAVKLSLPDFKRWINLELNGYSGDDDIPTYRKARAQIKLRNPYHGLVPCVLPQRDLADLLQQVEIQDPIGNLVHLLERDDGDGTLLFPLPDPLIAQLMRWQNSIAPLPPVRIISTGQIAVVIDAVRTKILDWSLDLESKGILGKGMQFTTEEKAKAVQMGSINIHNFQGVLGNVDGENKITQNFASQISAGNFDSLSDALKSHGVAETDLTELKDAIASDPKPKEKNSFGPKTRAWLSKMIAKSLDGTWNVGIEVAGNLLSNAISVFYGLPH